MSCGLAHAPSFPHAATEGGRERQMGCRVRPSPSAFPGNYLKDLSVEHQATYLNFLLEDIHVTGHGGT